MMIRELYEHTIKPLSAADRLRLAAWILRDIPPESVVDHRDDWSEEDLREAALHSFERAAESFGEEPADAASTV